MTTRLERSLNERIYLLNIKQNTDEWEGKIRGHTNNIYDFTINKTTCKCSCPDYEKKAKFCKHLLFIVAKVAMQFEIADKIKTNINKWTVDMFDVCNISIITRFQMRDKLTKKQAKSKKIINVNLDDDCPICYEKLENADGLTQCITTCKNYFHTACISIWLNSGNSTCPMCRCDFTDGSTDESGPKNQVDGATVDLIPNIDEETGQVEEINNIENIDNIDNVNMGEIKINKVNKVNIVISFDTTGSMSPCIAEVKRNVEQLTQKLFNEIPNLKIGIISHGDYCDKENCISIMDLNNNVDNINNFIKNAKNTGGGDFPECYELVLRETLKLSWDMDAADTTDTIKCIVLIGDAPPHERNENPQKIDWREEAEKLGNRNVQIFSVQCLNHGNRESFNFYSTIAEMTNGYHLFLEQFANINDMILAVCYKQFDTSQLELLQENIQKRNGGINNSLKLMFDTMLGKKTREEVRLEMSPENYHRRYTHTPSVRTSRIISTGPARLTTTTTTFGASGSTDDLRPVPPAKFQMFDVGNVDKDIRGFCEGMGITFAKGRGFYEFTKTETIQASKEIVLMEKISGNLYEGEAARKLLGLPDDANVKLKPIACPYYVFIQSTSVNRKLIANTRFLYEVPPP